MAESPAVASPVVATLPSKARYTVTIDFQKATTQPPVFLSGSLTSPPWIPIEMSYEPADPKAHPDGTGDLRFSKIIEDVEEGEHQYKFRLGIGDWWTTDPNVKTFSDDIGNVNNVITVGPDSRPVNAAVIIAESESVDAEGPKTELVETVQPEKAIAEQNSTKEETAEAVPAAAAIPATDKVVVEEEKVKIEDNPQPATSTAIVKEQAIDPPSQITEEAKSTTPVIIVTETQPAPAEPAPVATVVTAADPPPTPVTTVSEPISTPVVEVAVANSNAAQEVAPATSSATQEVALAAPAPGGTTTATTTELVEDDGEEVWPPRPESIYPNDAVPLTSADSPGLRVLPVLLHTDDSNDQTDSSFGEEGKGQGPAEEGQNESSACLSDCTHRIGHAQQVSDVVREVCDESHSQEDESQKIDELLQPIERQNVPDEGIHLVVRQETSLATSARVWFDVFRAFVNMLLLYPLMFIVNMLLGRGFTTE